MTNNKAASDSKTMELPGDIHACKYPRLGERIGQSQELDNCDLCIELAHFLSNLITLGRKKS